MDKIIVKELKVFAFHGVNPEEQRDGQLFIVDIVAHADLSKSCESDDVNDTVSYAKILKTAQRVMIEQKDCLLERVAQRIATALLQKFSLIETVEVTVKKPNAPIKADFAYTAVSIIRGRESFV
ncbi:MAG: dihydroneopterin aldolase [Oscillospiraceae bacterium]